MDKASGEDYLKGVEGYKILSSQRSDLSEPFFILKNYFKIKKILKILK